MNKVTKAISFKASLFDGSFKQPYLFPILVAFAFIFLCGQSQANPIPRNNNIRIMPLGDSITEGKFVGKGGYRQYLQNLLRAGGYAFTFVGKEDSDQPGTG